MASDSPSTLPFRPRLGSTLTIDAIVYSFTEHPHAPGRTFAQVGRKGRVYQVADENGELHALKVFKQEYRTPQLARNAEQLSAFAVFPGLQACHRTVLGPERHAELLRQYEELSYAVLMPWVYGDTWFEIIRQRKELTDTQSHVVAAAFAGTLANLETRQIAHCDLSGPNTLVTLDTTSANIALVDVEDLYAPSLIKPALPTAGSPGYAHRTAPRRMWGPYADRFAAAVLLGEMLTWFHPDVRATASNEQYFLPEEVQQPFGDRLTVLLNVLHQRWGVEIRDAFNQAWYSHELTECPTLGEWARLLGVPIPQRPVVDLQPGPTQLPPTSATATEDGGPPASDRPQPAHQPRSFIRRPIEGVDADPPASDRPQPAHQPHLFVRRRMVVFAIVVLIMITLYMVFLLGQPI